MDAKEILKFCLKNGLLIDRDLLNLFGETLDLETSKLLIEKIKLQTHKKFITKRILNENKEKVNNIFLTFPEENKKHLEKLKIKLGLNIEISKVSEVTEKHISEEEIEGSSGEVKIISMPFFPGKKLGVKDFVNHFRNRFLTMKGFLESHSSLNNLVSINKISGARQNFSIIGIVSDKRITKNKNIIFEVEDLTGKLKVLVNKSNEELYKKAEEVCLDSVLGFRGSGNREIIFTNDIIFPEANLLERKKSPKEEWVLFLGDLHFGSKNFLGQGFIRFLNYLQGKVPNTPEVDKIKYIFIVGDLITGVGNYPNQEKDLAIRDLENQFISFANFLKEIRKDIKIIISPGNHEGVRLMEPQPLFDEKYAWALYNLPNVILTTNPAEVNIGVAKNFSGFNVLTYHGFSFSYYANNIPSLIEKGLNAPEKIMKYLLRNRHLAPAHKSVQYFPSEEDSLIIKDVPDIFVAAHTHKSSISYYNNILIVSSSSWESKTPYQEKFGNEPDHCKVPMFNLKTRAVKVLDFEEDGDEN